MSSETTNNKPLTEQPHIKDLLALIKQLWLVLAFIAASAFYVSQSYTHLADQVQQLSNTLQDMSKQQQAINTQMLKQIEDIKLNIQHLQDTKADNK